MTQEESIETSRGQSTKLWGMQIFIRLENEGNQHTMGKGSQGGTNVDNPGGTLSSK